MSWKRTSNAGVEIGRCPITNEDVRKFNYSSGQIKLAASELDVGDIREVTSGPFVNRQVYVSTTAEKLHENKTTSLSAQDIEDQIKECWAAGRDAIFTSYGVKCASSLTDKGITLGSF